MRVGLWKIAHARSGDKADRADIGLFAWDAPTYEVLKREVFTKTLKGNLLVRKLLLWKTNKENEGANFPAYVVYYTDFSPGRATPLDRDIRVSHSREQIEMLWDEVKAENIVKGWVAV